MPPVCKVLISLYLLVIIFFFFYASGLMLFGTGSQRGLDLVAPYFLLTLPWSILVFMVGEALGRLIPFSMLKVVFGIFFGLGIFANCIIIYWIGRLIAKFIPGQETPVAVSGIPEKKKNPINIFNIIVVLAIVSYILYTIVE